MRQYQKIRHPHMMELLHTKRLPHKIRLYHLKLILPHMMELHTAMRLPNKIRLARMRQSQKIRLPHMMELPCTKEAASQNEAISSHDEFLSPKDDAALYDGSA